VLVETDPSSQVPVYEQVRTQIAEKISSEELPAGTKLPTIRGLAAELNLAVNTVAHAYRELEAAGLIVTRPRHGTTVAPGRSSRPGAASRERLRAAARDYAHLAKQLGIPPSDALAEIRASLEPDI
jgi:DNA-binding transcriptional regulator YhcF (GntR family)